MRTIGKPLSHGLRAWLVAYALLAIAWPSTGVLPWVVLELRSPDDVVVGQAYRHDTGERAHDDRRGADIPGSPTHPLDHDCAQCQVMKHLARCVPSTPDAPTVPPLVDAPVVASAADTRQPPSSTEVRPPIRAPPSPRA